MGLITEGDDETVYRMLRLLRMGATGDYAKRLDDQLGSFRELATKLADADAWAQHEYDAHFANSASLSEPPIVCGALP
jgi:hypothetical protein